MNPLRVLLLEAVPRRCVKCGHTYPTGEFQATSARCGVLVWKTWCRECLNTHYRDYERRQVRA